MTILYFGVVDWYYLRQRPQQLARELASHADVVYAYPRTLLGTWHTRPRLPAGARKAWRDGPEGEVSTLHLYEPFGFPRYRGQFLRSIGDALFLHGLGIELKRRRLRPDIVWIGHPSHERFIDSFADIPLVYDCMDDWGSFPDAGDVSRRESRLLKRARWVLASSRKLEARLGADGAPVHLVPNGVEHAHFRSALDLFEAAPVPSKSVRRKTALTVGTFGSWVDFELIRRMALACPDWIFQLVGPLESHPEGGLPREDNLVWLGRRPYGELPALMAAADAAFLPFRMDALTESVDPVKVYEFLAAGLPVAAVPLPELAKFKAGVVTARTAAEFREALESARALGATPGARRDLSASVATHSWAARAELVRSLLSSAPATGSNDPA